MVKNAKIDNINKGINKISTIAKCNECLEYGHIAVNCTNPVMIVIINGVLIVIPESESTFL